MDKKFYANKFWLIVGLCLMLALPFSNVFASNRDRDRGRGRSHEVVIVGHERYHYRDGRFYRPCWFGFEFSVFAPPIGAVVRVLPFGHRTIIVGGARYYYYDHVYYTDCHSGYMVVPVSVANSNVVTVPVATQPSGETVIINVPNAKGGYTPVKLVKQNNGYIGPQGEYYPGNPAVERLKALYGK